MTLTTTVDSSNGWRRLILASVVVLTLLITTLLLHSQLPIQAYYQTHHAAISAGCLSGSLHALTGADHLTALLPVIVTQRYWLSGSYGLLWGLGHGCASAMVGYLGYAMKGWLVQTSMSVLFNYRYVGDFIVAVTVLIIGVMGIYENTSEAAKEEIENVEKEDSGKISLTDGESSVEEEKGADLEAASVSTPVPPTPTPLQQAPGVWKMLSKRLVIISSVFINGIVLGLSWDGLPSLAPAMMLDDWQVVAFLSAYLVSTMLTMCFSSAMIGEISYWIAYHSKIETLSSHLARLSSYVACVIGMTWLALAVFKYTYATLYRDVTASNDNVFPGIVNSNDNVLEDLDSSGNTMLCVLSIVIVASAVLYSLMKDFQLSTSVSGYLLSHPIALFYTIGRFFGYRPNKSMDEVL